MGFDLEKRNATEDKDRPRDAEADRHDAVVAPRARTGKLALVYEQLIANEPALAQQPPSQLAAMPWLRPQGKTFDDFRFTGLRDVIATLASNRARHELIEPTIGAIDPTLVSRQLTPADTARGHAMWRVAERRAATLYRHAVDAGEVAADDPVVAEALDRCGSGQALPEHVRRQMERELGVRLDRVRVHTDSVAADAARAVRAEAFTVGEDIFFGQGTYAPDSQGGKKLLAHELQHVVQALQGRTRAPAAGIRVSDPNESLEREAEAVAERVVVQPPRKRAAKSRPARYLPAPHLARRALYRKAAAHAPAAKTADDNHDFKLTTHLKVHEGPAKHKHAHKENVKESITDFKEAVHRAKDGQLERAHDAIHAVKEHEHHRKLGSAAKDAKAHLKAHKADAHKHANHHHAHHDDHHGHDDDHDDHAPEGDPHSAVKFKPITDWSKYMPEPMPDQDERERKRILEIVKRDINEDREHSAKGFDILRKQQIKRAHEIGAMKPTLLGDISAAQTAALGTVSAAEGAQIGAVMGAIAIAKGSVAAHAAAMKGQVIGAHASAVSAINSATRDAQQQLTTGQQQALTAIDMALAIELVSAALMFTATKLKITALGASKASEASGLGDSVSLPYDGDKLAAAREAAHQVAAGYAGKMPGYASNACADISSGQSDAESQLRALADKQKETVRDQYQQAKQAIQTAHDGSIDAADSLKSETLSMIDSTASATQAQLTAIGTSTVAAIHGQASAARTGINAAASAARGAISGQIAQAVKGILGGAVGVLAGAREIETPDPHQTKKVVTDGAKKLHDAAQGIANGLSSTAHAAGTGMQAQASAAATGMASTAAGAKTSAQQLASDANQGMTSAAQAASTSLDQLASQHQKTCTTTVNNAEQGFKAIVDGTKTAFESVNGKIQSNLDSSYSDIEGKFNEAVPTQETADILAEAGKAAAKVKDKPWWKKALSVVASIVVAVVVTVVLTAVLGPLGPICAAVIAGAIGNAMGQITSNLIEGKSWHDGVGTALLTGAVGGGLGGIVSKGAGVLGTRLAASSSKLASAGTFLKGAATGGKGVGGWATRTGLNVAGDMAGDATVQVVTTGKYQFEWKNLATSVLANGMTSSPRFQGWSQRINASRYGKGLGQYNVDDRVTNLGKKGAGWAKKTFGGSDHPTAQSPAGHPHDAKTPKLPKHPSPAPHPGPKAPTPHPHPKPPHPKEPPPRDATVKVPKEQPQTKQPAPKQDAAPKHPKDEGANKQHPDETKGKHPEQPDKQHADKQHADKQPAREPKPNEHKPGDHKKQTAKGKPSSSKRAKGGTKKAKKTTSGGNKKKGGGTKKKSAAKKHEQHAAPKQGGAPKASGGDKGQAAKSHDGKHDLYPGASKESQVQAATDVEAGKVPSKQHMRDTVANELGRQELARFNADPNITPQEKQLVHRQLAEQLRAKPDPTGNLSRDLKEARAKVEQQTSSDPEDAIEAPTAQPAQAKPKPGRPRKPVQRKRSDESSDFGKQHPTEVAARGTQGAGGQLPFVDQIQRSFGRHDVGGIRAFQGGAATDAARALGARAYATGDAIAFASAPDLHTAAHEAAHVIQQRAGVRLEGDIDGGDSDPYEQHADAVAAAVVSGRSAEPLLGAAGPSGDAAVVQRKQLPGPDTKYKYQRTTEVALEIGKLPAKLQMRWELAAKDKGTARADIPGHGELKAGTNESVLDRTKDGLDLKMKSTLLTATMDLLDGKLPGPLAALPLTHRVEIKGLEAGLSLKKGFELKLLKTTVFIEGDFTTWMSEETRKHFEAKGSIRLEIELEPDLAKQLVELARASDDIQRSAKLEASIAKAESKLSYWKRLHSPKVRELEKELNKLRGMRGRISELRNKAIETIEKVGAKLEKRAGGRLLKKAAGKALSVLFKKIIPLYNTISTIEDVVEAGVFLAGLNWNAIGDKIANGGDGGTSLGDGSHDEDGGRDGTGDSADSLEKDLAAREHPQLHPAAQSIVNALLASSSRDASATELSKEDQESIDFAVPKDLSPEEIEAVTKRLAASGAEHQDRVEAVIAAIQHVRPFGVKQPPERSFANWMSQTMADAKQAPQPSGRENADTARAIDRNDPVEVLQRVVSVDAMTLRASFPLEITFGATNARILEVRVGNPSAFMMTDTYPVTAVLQVLEAPPGAKLADGTSLDRFSQVTIRFLYRARSSI